MDAWDYHIRKVDIAWQLAQKRLSDVDMGTATNQWELAIAEALRVSWEAVDKTFPPPGGSVRFKKPGEE